MRKNLDLGPYSYGGVPGGGAYGSSIRRHLETGDPVLVTIQHGDSLTLQRVPQVDCVVIVS